MLSTAELMKINRQTWSGHSHTEFCPHGSGEATEGFIEEAIKSGFKTYSITEHFPMPPDFYKNYVGSRHAIYTAAMSIKELPAYFEKMAALKKAYAGQIRILVGFEIDYLAKYRDWTTQMLNQYGDQMDDGILSVHFLPTKNGLRAVDDSELDFRDGVLKEYGSPLEVAKAYLSTVLEAVNWTTNNKPIRYGHIMLYRKWRNAFPPTTIWKDGNTISLMDTILKDILTRNQMLDCNMAGLFRPKETESSPNYSWLAVAKKMGIPLVYGSDAHKVSAVSQGYNTYLENHYYQ
ncbi:histidinol-phosphatase HisJ [Lentilactobacillus sunkii]|jgi:histidinol-phosphatase (PHP family)|nr:histidinol-phosphatase HisJ [Lentilactobacillus sunkii]